MKTMALGLVLMAALAGGVIAQTAGPAGSIDAASIKVDKAGGGHSSTNGDKGRITLTNVPLKSMIQTAFGLQPYQVVGPAWMQDERFDAVVTFTGLPAKQPARETERLLEPWLTREFALQTHHESRKLPGYLLLVAKGGAKMPPATECCGSDVNVDGNNHLVKFTGDVTMELFAKQLGRNLDRPVVIDQTGLAGNFHVEFSFAQNTLDAEATAATAPGPSIYEALERQLGLRLQAANVPVDLLVVDGASRVPAGN